MPDAVIRSLAIRISADDAASGVFQKVAKSAETASGQVAAAGARAAANPATAARVDRSWDLAAFDEFKKQERDAAKVAADAAAKQQDEFAEREREAKRVAARVDANWEAAQFQQFLKEERDAKQAAADGIEAEAGHFSAGARSGVFPSRGGSVLDSLKDDFGRGSNFSQIARALSGAGPLIGLGLASRELSQMGGDARKLAEGLGAAEIKSGEIPLKLAEAVPIVGGIVRGIFDLTAAVSGTAYEQAVITKEIERSADLYHAQQEHVRMVTRDIRDQADAVAKLHEALAQVNNGSDKSKIEDERQDAIRAARDTADTAKEKATDDYGNALLSGKKPIEAHVAFVKAMKDIDDQQRRDTERANGAADVRNAQLAKDAGEDRVNTVRATNRAIADAVAESSISPLRLAADLERDQIRKIQDNLQIAEKQIAMTERKAKDAALDALNEANKRFPANFQEHNDAYDQAMKRAKADAAAATDQARGEARSATTDAITDRSRERGEIDLQLSNERLRILEREGQYGDAAAAAEARRLRVAQDYNATKKQLQEILDDPKSRLDQRAAAQQAMDKLPAQQSAELRQSVGKEAHDLQMFLLKQQSEFGNLTAGIRMHVMEIQKEFADQTAHAKAIAADGGASVMDRLRAADFIKEAPGLEKREIDRATAIVPTRLAAPSFSGDVGRLTGADLQASRFGGGGKVDVAANTAEAAKSAADHAGDAANSLKLLEDFIRPLVPYASQLGNFFASLGQSGGTNLTPP